MIPSRATLERFAALFAGSTLFSPAEGTPDTIRLVTDDIQESLSLTSDDVGDNPDFANTLNYAGGDHQNRWFYDAITGELVVEQQPDAATSSLEMLFLSTDEGTYPQTAFGYAVIDGDSGDLNGFRRFASPVDFLKTKQGLYIEYPRMSFPLTMFR